MIKVEPREGGDPQRGLVTMGLVPDAGSGVNYMIEMPNRGKKSIGVDLKTPGGREVVLGLARKSDVFLTNYLPERRRKFRIDVADIRAVNPDISYSRGSAYGPAGPDADRPGYDGVSFWSRGGIADALSTDRGREPVQQTTAFGDLLGGLAIAGGIAAALYKRRVTGRPSIVDVSLLGLAAFAMTPRITASNLLGDVSLPTYGHADAPNPLVDNYRTRDGRYVTLMMLQGDRFFSEVVELIGRPDLASDARFATGEQRFEHRRVLIEIFDKTFAGRSAAEWRDAIRPLSGAWSIMQEAGELCDDAAVAANGYIPAVQTMSGAPYILPTNPVQFDERQVIPSPAPELGQHTEEVLLDDGLEWDYIAQLKDAGAIS